MNRSHYIYINSKNRNDNENIYNFNVYLNNPIICEKNEMMNISVVGFSMMNTDYNLRGLSFSIQEIHYSPINYSLLHTVTIPDGNYSYITLLNFLNNNIEINNLIKFEYIKERNSLKFINKLNEGIINIVPNNCNNILGLLGQTNIQTSYEGSYINLCNYSHIIIKSNYIDFEDNTQDNINNKELGSSSILFMIDKQDIMPFQLISYKNYDKSDNFSYNINNKQISSIDLHLYNERDEILKNTDDYFIIIKIVVFSRINVTSNDNIFEDIRFLLYSLFFEKNNLLL